MLRFGRDMQKGCRKWGRVEAGWKGKGGQCWHLLVNKMYKHFVSKTGPCCGRKNRTRQSGVRVCGTDWFWIWFMDMKAFYLILFSPLLQIWMSATCTRAAATRSVLTPLAASTVNVTTATHWWVTVPLAEVVSLS